MLETIAPATPEHVPSATSAVPPQAVILQAGLAYIVSACLNAAMKLNIPSLLGEHQRPVHELAKEAGVNAGYLARVLRVLETAGITRFTRSGVALTEAGLLLRTGIPGSLADTADWLCDPLHFQTYASLPSTVQNGDITFDSLHGEPFFHWLSRAENAEEAGVFNRAMSSISQMCVPAFLEAYDFGWATTVVDLGGGHGALVRAILAAHPHLNGIIGEIPYVAREAQAELERAGLASRCKAVDCDFFAGAPSGGDLYLMKHIIHDWADDSALTILRNIRSVIPPNGRLVLAESVLCAGPEPHPGKLLDIEMMVFVGGKERTEGDFRELLGRAGFRLERVIPTRSPICLLEALPVSN